MLQERIRTLRKAQKLTQEQLAECMHVSSQAVSKWETGAASPDIDMLPRLAAFFGTSVDDLLDFDRWKIEAEVERLVEESVPLRKDPAKAEAFYREALKKYPNNEVLLNCLLMVIPDSRSKEKIEIGERLIDATSDDEIRLDVLRILALTSHRIGEQAMAENYLCRLPELYFLKTEIASLILSGEAQKAEIEKTEDVCMGTLAAMLKLREELASGPQAKEELRKLREDFLDVFARDPREKERAERIRRQLAESSIEEIY